MSGYYESLGQAVDRSHDMIAKFYPAATIIGLHYDYPPPSYGPHENTTEYRLFQAIAEKHNLPANYSNSPGLRDKPAAWCWIIKEADGNGWWFEYTPNGGDDLGTAGYHTLKVDDA